MSKFLGTLILIRLLISTKAIDWTVRKPKVCVDDENFSLFDNGEAKEVSVALKILQLYDFDEGLMQFTIQALLMLFWKDRFIPLDGLNVTAPVILPKHIVNCIWQPDIVFYNSKDSSQFMVTFPNTVTKLIPGDILYQYSRYNIIVSCQLDFREYPLDTQACSMYIQLFRSRDNEARLGWTSESQVDVVRKMKSIIVHTLTLNKLQQFSIEEVRTLSHRMHYPSGNTTVLNCLFQFRRYTMSCFVNTYIPSFLVVCVSYVSFWLDVEAIPGRVTLCVTAFLTIATQMVSARNALPSVNYLTALDAWLSGCLILVFTSMIEFTIAHALSRYFKSKLQTKTSCSCSALRSDSLSNLSESGKKWVKDSAVQPVSKTPSRTKPRIVSSPKDFNLDKTARIAYPIIALSFVVIYWLYYLRLTNRI